jgi:hypothetical protein
MKIWNKRRGRNISIRVIKLRQWKTKWYVHMLTFKISTIYQVDVAVSFSGGRNWSTRWKPPTCHSWLPLRLFLTFIEHTVVVMHDGHTIVWVYVEHTVVVMYDWHTAVCVYVEHTTVVMYDWHTSVCVHVELIIVCVYVEHAISCVYVEHTVIVMHVGHKVVYMYVEHTLICV